MKATLEWTMQGLSRRLTQEEFFTLARIMASADSKAVEKWQSTPPDVG